MQPENWIPEKERPSFFTTDLPENSRTFMLQVQKQPDGQVCGSIHNLYLEQPQIFSWISGRGITDRRHDGWAGQSAGLYRAQELFFVGERDEK